jgi:hypothetical protein
MAAESRSAASGVWLTTASSAPGARANVSSRGVEGLEGGGDLRGGLTDLVGVDGDPGDDRFERFAVPGVGVGSGPAIVRARSRQRS